MIANYYACEIREQCLEIGISLEKAIFLYNNYILEDINKNYEFIRKKKTVIIKRIISVLKLLN